MRRLFSSVRGYVRLRLVLLILVAGAIVVVGAPPAWWGVRGVITSNAADDYAPINQGQLKNLVKAAVQEMNLNLPSGAGQVLDALVAGWATPTAKTDDYAAVNVGQLKAVTRLMYDRFKQEGYVTDYPWDGSASPPDDYAMANIGQAKNLFAFDLRGFKIADGIAYRWKIQYGLNPNDLILAGRMAPGGLTYLQKYQMELNPNEEDTDGDGVSDSDEVACNTDPLDPASKPALNLRIAMKTSAIGRLNPGFVPYTTVTGESKYYLKRVEHYELTKVLHNHERTGTFDYTTEVIPSEHKSKYDGHETIDDTYRSGGQISGKRNLESTSNGYKADTLAAGTTTGKEHAYRLHTFLSTDYNLTNGSFTSRLDEDTGYYDVEGDFPNETRPWPHWFHSGGYPTETSNWSGTSSELIKRYNNSALFSSRLTSATKHSDGSWTGIETPGNREVNDWYWLGDIPALNDEEWNLIATSIGPAIITYDWTYIDPFDPNQTYDTHHVWGSITLSQPYTAFLQDSIADLPAYPATWTESPMPVSEAYRNLPSPEDFIAFQKLKYRLRADSSPAQRITWYEYFTPEDDPATSDVDESTQVKVHSILTWDKATAQTESREYEIIPSASDGNGSYTVAILSAALIPDANHNVSIDASDKGVVTEKNPWSFWLNDDDDVNAPGTPQQKDCTAGHVNGAKDLEDFFPVFLDIRELAKGLPRGSSVKYRLKQADGAVKIVETILKRDTAFAYRGGTLPTGFGTDLTEPASSATTRQVTAAGVELSEGFLNHIRVSDGGVILVEGCLPTTQPLVLTVEKDGAQIAEVSLPLALNARILLLLHGMNSNTLTWNTFVENQIGYPAQKWAADIRVEDKAITGNRPMLTSHGVRCYQLQFGGYENGGNTQPGLGGLTAANAPNYLRFRRTNQCGDFETFDQLGQEVDDAISLLVAKPEYQNAQIMIMGHSRGGIAARAFLQMAGANANKSAVVGLLTTGTPHLGSRMGRIYQWLKDHPKPATGSNDDWDVVKTLFEAPGGIDLRRPVIGDVADKSTATVNLNLPGKVAKMPASIRYGQIVYMKSDLGRLARVLFPGTSTYVVYSVFGSGVGPGPQLSGAAQTYLLAGVAPAGYPGDGLIPGQNQRFPAALRPAAGNVVTLEKAVDDVLHIEEPGRHDDIQSQLLKLMRPWFLYP